MSEISDNSSSEPKLTRLMSRVPARLVLSIFGFLAIANAYTMRTTLNLTITQMVHQKARYANETINYDLTCGAADGKDIPERLGFDWSEELQGIILGSFFWGYALTHLPGGILSTKYGGKYTLGLGILSTAIFTLITPVVINWGGGNALIVLRILEGVGEGTTYPAVNTLLAAWIPRNERAMASAFVYGGAQIGNIAANSISGLLLDYFEGWSSPFYFFGICGVVWFIFFQVLCYKDPQSHPFLSKREKDYLQQEMNQLSRDENLPSIPWKSIVTSGPLIALVITQIGHGFGYFAVVTDLPKYMNDVLKFNVKSNGLLTSLPYLAMWISSIAFGVTADWLISRNKIKLINSRKLNTTLSFTVPGLFLVAASYSGCNRTVAVAMFTIAMGFMGAYYSGMKANALDLSPNYAGLIMAISNGLGSLPGFVAPYIIGVIAKDKTLPQWRTVFYITCGVLVVTNIVFVIWGSGKVQPWDDPRKSQTSSEENDEAESKKKDKKTTENP